MKNLYIILGVAAAILAKPGICISQPYIDLINIQYINSPEYGFTKQKKNPTSLKHFYISSTLPFQFKNKSDAIIISPYFEMWSPEVQYAHTDFERQYGVALPVSFLKTLPNPDWSILSTVVIRRNGYTIDMEDNWQIGGAFLVNFKANENLRYKMGIYANKEFFGLFVIPLIGVDWKISNKTNLFGLLPANLALEHKLHRNIYTGALFRAITNSYKQDTGYWRIDENQLGIFLDYYLSKKLVLNMEAGHTILRKIKSGTKGQQTNNWNASDNFYCKLAIAYRIRLR